MRLEKNFQTFIGHSSPVSRIMFTPDNSTLISVGDSILFWDFMAFKSEQEDGVREMPQGRELENMRDMPIAVVREAQNSNVNDCSQLRVLNESWFDEMRSRASTQQQAWVIIGKSFSLFQDYF
jgi:WD40 repeat protein